MDRGWRWAARVAVDLAEGSCGVVARASLHDGGVDRHAVRTLIRRDVVVPHGAQALHVRRAGWDAVRSPIAVEVINSGAGAWADGVSALLLAGLRGWEAGCVDIGLATNGTVRARSGVRERRVRCVPTLRSVPVARAREDFAAVRAASFAATDRAAAALLAMTVQQRLTTPPRLAHALTMYPTIRRRKNIDGFIRDIGGGSQSIDELAFVAHLRRRGLPLPDRQVVRQGPDGRSYLDARWHAARLVAEIDGAHHLVGAHPIADALRQNALALDGDRVIRIPNIGMRSDPDAFLDQIEGALIEEGVIDEGVVEKRAPQSANLHNPSRVIVVRPSYGPDSSTLAAAGSSLQHGAFPAPEAGGGILAALRCRHPLRAWSTRRSGPTSASLIVVRPSYGPDSSTLAAAGSSLRSGPTSASLIVVRPS